MAITAFQANELVTRANVNSRLTEVDNKFTSVEGDITTLNGKFPVSIANGGTGGTSETAARTNLGLMKAYTIYWNSSGAQGTINYDTGYTTEEFPYIEIFYFCKVSTSPSIWSRNSVRVTSGSGYKANMIAMYHDGTTFHNYTRTVEFGTSSISLTSNTRGTMGYKSTSSGSVSTSDEIYVYQIVGYKY